MYSYYLLYYAALRNREFYWPNSYYASVRVSGLRQIVDAKLQINTCCTEREQSHRGTISLLLRSCHPKKIQQKKSLLRPDEPQKLFAAQALCSSFSFMSFFWFTTSGAHTHTVRGTHVHTHVCIVCTYVFTNVSIYVCIRMYILLCVHSLKGKWKSPTLVFLLADWNA